MIPVQSPITGRYVNEERVLCVTVMSDEGGDEAVLLVGAAALLRAAGSGCGLFIMLNH